jgi:hypothetical protein
MTVKVWQLLLLGAAGVVLAGCGSSSSSDPASQIRHNYHAMFAALKDNNLAKMCSYTVNSGGCLLGAGMANGFAGSGKFSDLFTDQDLELVEQQIDAAPIQVSPDGTRAIVGTGRDADKWVKRGSDWKEVN